MDISIGSYKFRGYVVAFVLFAAWVMWTHLICSCSTVKDWREGFDIAAGTKLVDASKKKEKKSRVGDKKDDKSAEEVDAESSDSATEEGFSNIDGPGPASGSGSGFAEKDAPGYIRNPDTWTSVTSYDYSQDTGETAEGSLDIFSKMKFGYECCPNAYSNSQGCACMGTSTLSMLKGRGGNNVPYSEY